MTLKHDPHVAATKLAQLLGDVIIHHTPESTKAANEEHRKAIDGWLDGLEAHTARFVGPFLQQILDNSDPPDAVRALLEEAINPTAAFSSTVEQIFLFGIVSTILSTSVQPFVQGVANELNQAAVGLGIARPIDPSILATAVARGLSLTGPYTLDVPKPILDEAAKSGVSNDAMKLAASVVGLPPALQELFELYRRGAIPLTSTDPTVLSVETGLREGDFRDDWIQTTLQLAHAYLTPLDFVRGAVQAQTPYATAEEWAGITGLDITKTINGFTPPAGANNNMFGLAYAIAGRPPGPEEMARMVHRGLIPEAGVGADVLSFQQGIAESDIKTKWTDVLYKLSTYVPAPEATATLLERGGLSPEQAAIYWADSGLDAPTISALLYVASQQHVTQEKLLAKGEIVKGYYDGIFSNQQATALLGDLGYIGDVAAEILEIQDFRRQIRAIDQVVRKIGTYYESYKISATNALATLQQLGISQEEATALLGTWDQLRIRPLRLPTTSEIAKAVQYKTLTQDQALAMLTDLGYEPRDAAVVLSAGSETQITPLPPAGTTTTT